MYKVQGVIAPVMYNANVPGAVIPVITSFEYENVARLGIFYVFNPYAIMNLSYGTSGDLDAKL